jgi:cytoskeletal protein RodZ
MNRVRTRGPARVLGLAALLLIVALVVGACVTPPAPAAPMATTAPPQAPAATTASTQASATNVPAQTPAISEPAASSNLPTGVDSEGHFYRGDPKATVKLIEFSDFQ